MSVPECSMDLLVALVAVAESKTKEEAARRLKISVSALNKRFKTGSSLYGVPLVHQSDSEIRLTDEGHLLYPSAVQSVDFASLAEETLRARILLKLNDVLVGHSTYLAPQLLAMVHGLRFDEHPRIRVKHRAGLTGSIARSVREGELLAGFGFLPLLAPELVVRKVWDEPLMVCIPSSHSVASRSVIRPEDLDGQALIAVGRDPVPGMHEEMEIHFASMGVAWKIVADAFAPMEALNLVEQKVGICILSQSSAVPHPGVTVRPLWTRTLRRFSAFFHREDDRSPILDELSKIVLERSKQLSRATKQAGRRAG